MSFDPSVVTVKLSSIVSKSHCHFSSRSVVVRVNSRKGPPPVGECDQISTDDGLIIFPLFFTSEATT